MSLATISPSITRRSPARRDPHSRALPSRPRRSFRYERVAGDRSLAHYLDVEGHPHELVVLSGHGGSVLVLDYDITTSADGRLLAHLAADEPPENAALICRHYLEHARPPDCRAVCSEDFQVAPLAEGDHDCEDNRPDTDAVDRDGNTYRLRLITGEHSTVQLRWCRLAAGSSSPWERVSLRDVVGAMESYEPMRTRTEHAIACRRGDPSVVLTRLHWELERLSASPIVLNRGLREAVLRTVGIHGTSMSEVARRCGAVKRNRQGNLSGETSWLARRIGIMPEGGGRNRTPWVHSDVLAVIARKGLNISPREVELS